MTVSASHHILEFFSYMHAINAALIHASLTSHLEPRVLLATAAIATLRHNVQNHLACLLAAVPGADDLDGFIHGLVTGNLDLGARLLAEVVDGATPGANDEPILH